MRPRLRLLLALVLGSSVLHAQETFEGTPNAPTLLGTFNGFTWLNMYSANGCQVGPTLGYCRGVVSGTQMAFNGFASDVAITNGGTFDFGGAWFTAGFSVFPQGGSTAVEITGFLNGNAIYSAWFGIDDITPRYFSANWTGVDKLYLASRPGGPNGQFVMDDISLRATQTVPEPASFALVGIGIVGIALRRRITRMN